MTMTEYQLIALWSKARQHVIISQLGPIFLLIATVGLLCAGLGHAALSVRIGAAGILLASGLLGSLAQFSAASEAMAVADDLRATGATSVLARQITQERPWANIVKFVTPAIFVAVFLAILFALFSR